MQKITFYKYQGTGNDFVMIDNRALFFPKENQEAIALLCDRRFGIGADGLILLENDATTDFRMVYYNSDGSESTMCGNGGRCIVAFAKQLEIIKTQCTFMAVDGLHHATIKDDEVALQMIDVNEVRVNEHQIFVHTGSPHHIVEVNNLESYKVFEEGKKIRYAALYTPGGTNVNFVEAIDTNHYKVRTYERGVEDETFSCGTGATAVAIAMHHLGKATKEEIGIVVPGGSLAISFSCVAPGIYENVILKGPAKKVFSGEISINS